MKSHVLPWINRLLRLASVKLVTVNSPNRDFSEFFVHLRALGLEFVSVIDVGVAFGSPALYESMRDAKFYLVEPVPACKPLLDRLATQLNAETFNVAAGATDGSMTFFVHPDTSGSSGLRQIEGEGFDGEAVEVPVRRLDSLIGGVLARPCLLKIDTQGAELAVLEGARGILAQVDVIIIETSFHQFRHGAPELHDIVSKMFELGWVAYEILEGHYRSVDHALAQVDIAFVKVDSPLRAHKGFFSGEQARQYLARTKPSRSAGPR